MTEQDSLTNDLIFKKKKYPHCRNGDVPFISYTLFQRANDLCL